MQKESEEYGLSDPEDETNEASYEKSGLPLTKESSHEKTSETEQNEHLKIALKKALEDLEQEKQARIEADNAKVQVEEAKSAAFARFKVFAQEAVKQRDEANHQRDQLQQELQDTKLSRDEAMQLKESAQAEMQQAATVISSESDRILKKLGFQEAEIAFRTPTSGLVTIVGMFRKKLESAVDEVLKQRDSAQEQSEQRSIELAIESSRLEAKVTTLSENSEKLESELGRLKVQITDLNSEISTLKNEILAKNQKIEELGDIIALEEANSEKLSLNLAESESKSQLLETSLRHQVEETRNVVLLMKKVKSTVSEAKRFVSGSGKEGENEEEILDEGDESLSSQAKAILNSCRDLVETAMQQNSVTQKNHLNLQNQKQTLSEKVSELEKELQRRQEEVHKFEAEREERRRVEEEAAAEKAEREKAEEGEISARDAVYLEKIAELEGQISHLKRKVEELEQQVKLSREEVEDSRSELTSCKENLELTRSALEEAENRESMVVQEVGRLHALVSELEEESSRWQNAASDEAAAGSAVLEELQASNEKVEFLQRRIAELKQTEEDLSSKVKLKEAMAQAASLAREAAEQSLAVAERRIAELRQKAEANERTLPDKGPEGQAGCLDAALPWFVQKRPPLQLMGFHRRPVTRPPVVAEMEDLSEPLM